MKKFKNGDIIYNAIKTYPKVRFFANSGSLYYNNTKYPAVINDFLRSPPTAPIETDECLLLLEDGGIILAENTNFIELESCPNGVPQNFILTDEGQLLTTEPPNPQALLFE